MKGKNLLNYHTAYYIKKILLKCQKNDLGVNKIAIVSLLIKNTILIES